MKLAREEINRKLLHMCSGTLVPAAMLYIPSLPHCTKWTPAILLACTLTISLTGEFLRFRVPAVQKLVYFFGGSMLRSEESKKITGSTWIIASALICAVLFVDQMFIASMVLCLFILGDAVAALVGISIGHIKIGKKSLEGSLACFVLCMVLCMAVFPHVPHLLDSWDGHLSSGLMVITSLCITIFELVPIKIGTKFTINDNLVVPVIAGVVMKYLYGLV